MKPLVAIRNLLFPVRILQKIGPKAPGFISCGPQIEPCRQGDYMLYGVGITIDSSFRDQMIPWTKTQGFKWAGSKHSGGKDTYYVYVARWEAIGKVELLKAFVRKTWVVVLIGGLLSALPSYFELSSPGRFAVTFIIAIIALVVTGFFSEIEKSVPRKESLVDAMRKRIP